MSHKRNYASRDTHISHPGQKATSALLEKNSWRKNAPLEACPHSLEEEKTIKSLRK
jgi:hypothetical protein